MKTLLIDLGNTALKWCIPGEEESPRTVVHRGVADGWKQELYAEWLREAPKRVVGCTVAAPEIALSATKFFNEHGIRWEWVRPQRAFWGPDFQLMNSYANPEQLGSDRWNAAIGAVAAAPGSSLLVVQMGTAATVDAIAYEGGGIYRFLGGRIAPGPTLMQRSIDFGIPSISSSLGERKAFPKSTADALASGIIDAQVGLVLRALDELRRLDPQTRVLLSGGAASFIGPHLASCVPNLIVRHNLVLRGLAQRAECPLK